MSVADEPGFFFLDTNILVYALDRDAPAKQKIAEQLVSDALGTRHGLISIQVVQEFISLALRKFERRMTIPECREYLQIVLLPLCQYFPSISSYDRALQVVQETDYHFYDALIVAAAIESGCRTLLTEDLQHGRQIQGLTILNPFLELE
jgi:predicted nucleic acid-binding protein